MRICIVIVTAIVFAMSCAPARDGASTPPARATEAEPYAFEAEGKIPAPENEPAEADVEELPLDETELAVEEAVAPVDTTTPPVMIDGFRVQLFASGVKETADFARRTAAERLGVAVYVELVEAVYKVRAGDCATREEAEALRAKCQSSYYKDAWIVPTRVLASSSGGQ